MSSPIILYDIPAADPKNKCWSPNTWKARYALNIKGLAYKTEWVEYPDIEAVSKKLGAPATGSWPDGRPMYTLPMISDPSTNKIVTDSAAIVKYLDDTYPATPALFPAGTDAFQAAFHEWLWGTVGSPMFMTVILPSCTSLNPPSQKYFRETREKLFGPLEALATDEKWAALESGLGKLKGFYEANGAGKDLLLAGDRITYSDVQVASMLVWARVTCGEDSTVWKRLTALHGGKWAKVLEQFKAYEAVDA